MSPLQNSTTGYKTKALAGAGVTEYLVVKLTLPC